MRLKLSNKKVHVGHNFIALFKGKEENFRIVDIDEGRKQREVNE